MEKRKTNNKKVTKKKTNGNKKITEGRILPQNIVPLGERVEEDKNIYISQAVYKEIHRFTKDKLTNESGGMLIGNVIEEFEKSNIIIQGFIEAKYCEATPATLKFTHETWDYVHSQIAKRFQGGKIVGWIHTHPDFGIFLSEYDKFIQDNFFKEEYQIAYVVDPIQHKEGFYFWINGKIEKCKGFYVFDKPGKRIEIGKKAAADTGNKGPIPGVKPILTYAIRGIAAVVFIVLAVIIANLLNRIKIIESQQENLLKSTNQNISYLQQQIITLENKMENVIMQYDDSHSMDEEMDEGFRDSLETTSNAGQETGHE